MRITQITRQFLFRQSLEKINNSASARFGCTEKETNFLIGILLMNRNLQKCSGNTLFKYLSKVHRTPNKKAMLATLRRFKNEDLIRQFGNGAGSNLRVTEAGKLFLFGLEKKAKVLKVPKRIF
jgi:Mg2+/Co2+ transporter CorC